MQGFPLKFETRALFERFRKHAPLFLSVAAAVSVCIFLRAKEIKAWNTPLLRAGGEWLLSTHDAYAWLAGAKGINHYENSLLSLIVRLLNGLTGWSMGDIGFWLPVFISPLVVVPVCVLAFRWKVPEAAAPAGILSGASLGFLQRTRLGVFDSDVLTLFFAVSMAVFLILWLDPLTKTSRPGERDAIVRATVLKGISVGLFFRAYTLYYANGVFIGAGFLVFACVSASVVARKEFLATIMAMAAVVFLMGAGGWAGFGAGLVFGALVYFRPGIFESIRGAGLVFLSLTASAVLFSDLGSMLRLFAWNIFRYGGTEMETSGIQWPFVTESVMEATPLNFRDAIVSLSGHPLLFFGGLAGYAFLVFRKPHALTLLPLMLLGSSCMLLAERFSMYGGPFMAVGLTFGAAFWIRRKTEKPRPRAVVQIVLCAIFILVALRATSYFRPAIVLPKETALALQALKEKAALDAQVWIWWDFGYFAQYWSERTTFADGERNRGEYVHPLAKVHMSRSASEACRLMAFTAYKQAEAGVGKYSRTEVPFFTNPYEKLSLDEMESSPSFLESHVPEQYLAVTWNTLTKAFWISNFGSRDLETGATAPSHLFVPDGKTEMDLEKWTITFQGNTYRLATVDMIMKDGLRQFEGPTTEGWHALINQETREFYVVDSALYDSMMVRMLFDEPETFRPYFEPVAESSPWIRIYRMSFPKNENNQFE